MGSHFRVNPTTPVTFTFTLPPVSVTKITPSWWNRLRKQPFEHPHGAQAFAPGPRSLPVGGVSDLQPDPPASAFLAGALPPVRGRPGEGERQVHSPRLSHGLFTRVEENQTRVAGPELCDRQGRLDPLAVEARDCTHDRPTASRGVAPGSSALTSGRRPACRLRSATRTRRFWPRTAA